jgi:hypothetical protein
VDDLDVSTPSSGDFMQRTRPQRTQQSEGYAYGDASERTRPNGAPLWSNGGFGLQSGLIGSEDGLHASSDLLSANFVDGARQEDDGSWTYGQGLGGKVAGVNVGYGERGQGNFLDFQADALGADAQAYLNPENGANVGATAYWAQAALTGGNIGTGAADSEGRIGLAAGVGAAGRLHWGDADGDGNREYGFGADIGPLTFDVRSEDPVADFIPGMGLVRDLTGSENLTNSIGSGLASAGRGIANGASAAASWIGGAFSGW